MCTGVEPLLADSVPSVIDNACGALARVIAAHAARVPLEALAQGLVQRLPLREDMEEVDPVLDALALLLQSAPHLAADVCRGVLAALAACACLDRVPMEPRQRAARLLMSDPYAASAVLREVSEEQRRLIEDLCGA